MIVPFSVDHVVSLEVTDERFARPADFDLRRFLADNCFNGIHGAPVRVTLRARGLTACVFAERTFHPSQRVVARTQRTARRAETTTIEMTVASGRGLVRFVLSYAPDVEVLEPAALRDEVAEAHRRALAINGAERAG